MELMNILIIIATSIVAYLLGSLNFAIITTKIIKNDDIRRHGSKNAGTTNVLRVFGKSHALLVFIGDLLKGIAAIYMGRIIFNIFHFFILYFRS